MQCTLAAGKLSLGSGCTVHGPTGVTLTVACRASQPLHHPECQATAQMVCRAVFPSRGSFFAIYVDEHQ